MFDISNIMYACVIIHNMTLDDESMGSSLSALKKCRASQYRED